MSSDKDKFCSFPFNSFYTYNTGTVRICCDSEIMGRIKGKDLDFENIWNGHLWTEVRRSFLEGKQHPACGSCWEKEERGELSSRQVGNKKRALSQVNPDGVADKGPEEVHIRLGNECNLKCIICTPHNSTRWYSEADIYKKYVDDNFGNEVKAELLQDSWTEKTFSHANIILFAGGEPLIIPQHEKILDHLIETGRCSEVELIYYTNGTFFPASVQEKLRRFEKITFNVSIDGVGDIYNYVRYPAQWDKTVEILHQFDQFDMPNFSWRIVSVFYTLTAFDTMNLFKFRNSIQWRTPPDIILQDLTEPKFFDARCFSTEKKSELTDMLRNISDSMSNSDYERRTLKMMEECLNMEGALDEIESFKITRNYLDELDQKKKTDYRKALQKIQGLV